MKKQRILTSSRVSAASRSPRTRSSEKKISNTSSLNGTPSAKQSSASTGRKRNTIATSAPLLPTPRTNDAKGSAYQYSRGNHEKPVLTLTGRISSLAASHASLSVSLDEEKERQMTATSGRQCLKPSLFSSPSGSSLKMLRDSLLGTTAWYSRQCALTWKEKVTKYSRSLFQLAPSVRPIGEIEYGLLLATPNTMDSMPPKSEKAVLREATITRPVRTKMSNLRDQLCHGILLPTVRTSEAEGGTVKDAQWNGSWYRTNRNGTRHGVKVKDALGSKQVGLKLQPSFALWMMGFPTDWCDLADGEMPRSKRQGTP